MIATSAFAQEASPGDAIRAAIAGNTVQGSMAASGPYDEFYASDGLIKAADYDGHWSIEADQMCFAYGSEPVTCWRARIEGDQITWLGDSGAEGTGTIRPGNPGNY